MTESLDEIIENLKKNGSTFDSDTLKKIKKEVIDMLQKDESIAECLRELTKELEEKSSEFIFRTNKVISGLSSVIYLPNKDGNYSITIYGGKTGYDSNDYDIDEKTIFDLASITKLYTFLLTLKLMEKGYLKKEDKISELDNRFISLKDYTVEDILKMSGTIKTVGLVAQDKAKAFDVLKTTYVEDHDKTYNNYTDLGFIILSKVIEKIVSEKLEKEMTFDEIMNEYLLKPWGLNETMFYPNKEYHITGNGNNKGLVHDPKSRILGGAVGSAGLFATSNDLKHLSGHLFKVSNVNYTKLMGSIIYPHTKNSNKGYAGIYQKHPLGLKKTFVPNEYGTGAFASQGFTGSVAVFDSKNNIHNHVLVNSIKNGESKKPDGYMNALTIYQIIQTEITIKTYLITKYYQMIGYNENVDIYRRAK